MSPEQTHAATLAKPEVAARPSRNLDAIPKSLCELGMIMSDFSYGRPDCVLGARLNLQHHKRARCHHVSIVFKSRGGLASAARLLGVQNQFPALLRSVGWQNKGDCFVMSIE